MLWKWPRPAVSGLVTVEVVLHLLGSILWQLLTILCCFFPKMKRKKRRVRWLVSREGMSDWRIILIEYCNKKNNKKKIKMKKKKDFQRNSGAQMESLLPEGVLVYPNPLDELGVAPHWGGGRNVKRFWHLFFFLFVFLLLVIGCGALFLFCRQTVSGFIYRIMLVMISAYWPRCEPTLSICPATDPREAGPLSECSYARTKRTSQTHLPFLSNFHLCVVQRFRANSAFPSFFFQVRLQQRRIS